MEDSLKWYHFIAMPFSLVGIGICSAMMGVALVGSILCILQGIMLTIWVVIWLCSNILGDGSLPLNDPWIWDCFRDKQ